MTKKRNDCNDWFRVDREGLRKLVASRPKTFIIAELYQNAVDTDATRVEITLPPPKRGKTTLTVEDDDPNGFANLEHAYTMFAESEKKVDPTKRGRFNMGEKLVLALCETAEVVSTRGTVRFDAKGRHSRPAQRASGSVFCASIKMTKAEWEQCCEFARWLLVPDDVEVTFNGKNLIPREPLATFRALLYTEVADKDGVMQKAERVTEVRVFNPLPDEEPTIFELGIPVCPGDEFHVDVQQKIPLNMDRDNVSRAWRRKLRVVVYNEIHEAVEDHTATWVAEATGDKRAAAAAVETMLDYRFGPDRVAADMSDREAEKISQSQGRKVVHGGSMTKGQWDNAKAHNLIKPAGQVTPSPKAFDGKEPTRVIDPAEWTPGMNQIADHARVLGIELLDATINVEIINDAHSSTMAAFGPSGRLILNVGNLGYGWFDRGRDDAKVNELLIHEFGHWYSDDHLSETYHDALCDLGARLILVALRRPERFEERDLGTTAALAAKGGKL